MADVAQTGIKGQRNHNQGQDISHRTRTSFYLLNIRLDNVHWYVTRLALRLSNIYGVSLVADVLSAMPAQIRNGHLHQLWYTQQNCVWDSKCLPNVFPDIYFVKHFGKELPNVCQMFTFMCQAFGKF